MRRQSLKEKKGEIEFRKHLSKQHTTGITIFPYEYNQQEILEILRNRVEKSKVDFKIFKIRNVPLSPFLEIGAERCQRAMLLTNQFQAYGVATDISIDSLKTAQYFRRQVRMETMPERVCCDAYNLPFRKGAFAFAFCYQTLHHFPDPTPILTEVKRILRHGGYFFFDEEPVKGIIERASTIFALYRRWTKPKSFIEKILLKTKILRLISRGGKAEVSYNVMEASFTFKEWDSFLKVFEEKNIYFYISGKAFDVHKLWDRVLFWLIGSTIKGLCRKT